MDWFLKHPQIIVFLAFFVIVTLANRAAAKKRASKELSEQQRAARQQGTGRNASAPVSASTDEARARQAQEEIRRKILERMQAAGAQQPQRPAAMPRPMQPKIPRASERSIPRAGATATATAQPPPLPLRQTTATTPATDPSLAAYREATAELAQLEAMSQNADANRDQDFALDPTTANAAATATASASANTLDDLTATLRSPDTLRRAILLREILGAPIGLR